MVTYHMGLKFVGGESVSQTIPLIAKLRRQGKGVLLVYSVEHDDGNNGAQHEGSYRQNIVEMERAIDTVGDFEEEQRAQSTPPGKTWIAIKLVGSYSECHRHLSHWFFVNVTDRLVTVRRKSITPLYLLV